ncbi:MAG: ADP-ribosylglycohydrolase family protein [Planctomycetota bacterium]|jgi:ADP-ribosylglycohydrolase|nr:ADP-ribosylglycohydrolase family protein [Planctomycetota bacterium]
MLGAIIGDICGSVYEYTGYKNDNPWEIGLLAPDAQDIPGKIFFTDDTVMTIAIAEAALGDKDYAGAMRKWGRKYPDAGYGGMFCNWLKSDDPKPYNNYGNGSAMRVSAIGWLANDLDECLAEARNTALPTHNHPEGIKGAQTVAAAIFLALQGKRKDSIEESVAQHYDFSRTLAERGERKDAIKEYVAQHYDLSRTLAEIRPNYEFNETCQATVPEAITCFLESLDYESTIQNAISLGGDADTLACIAGSIAEAFYGTRSILPCLVRLHRAYLPNEFKDVYQRFGESDKIQTLGMHGACQLPYPYRKDY